MNEILKTVDLFAGGGGLSIGFSNAGFKMIAAFDNWIPALNLYNENIKDHPIFNWDLNDPNTIEKIESFKPSVIIGGPPCQDFSPAGKRDESLGRADLTITYAKIVKAIKPKWFIMENVERAKNSIVISKLRDSHLSRDYGLTEVVLDASKCGVPQRRKRLFIIGELNGKDDALLPIIERNLSNKSITIRDHFGNSFGIEHYYRHPRSYHRRAIFSIDEPSPTIRGVNRPIPSGYKGHPGDTAPISKNLRPLTSKERALIQTFPDSFRLIGTKSQIEQIIGNAVPVKLAEFVANCIKEYIDTPVEKRLHSHKVQQLSFLHG